jgi:cytochrome c-type biogenesis protein CcmE
MSKGLQIGIAATTVLAGLIALLGLGTAGEGTFSYYEDVSSYLAAPAANDARRGLRIHGFVVAGSIAKDVAAGHIDFRIADKDSSAALPVRYAGLDVPDLFRDGAEVVVEGRRSETGFAARRVMAKCPSKYEARPDSPA